MREFVLASASPRRKELLTQIGIEFRICSSKKEELPLRDNPVDVVKSLSYAKARDVFEKNPDAVIIGADTIVVNEGKILGKPKDEEEAYDMILGLQDGIHEVYTGVTLIWSQDNETHISSFYQMTKVQVYHMSEKQIREYISTKEPYDKAGGYAIQGYFARYIKQIKGDYNNVVGLPVGKLYQIMQSLQLID